ncbi:enoyl-CoA hydratase (plasmid) [Mycobacterium paragordonae]|uniref:Enoyl-CoA hydratase echA12 n=1 Tax=Mycobacterium paragordonae TaxID=1389713 RepID=A0ABQ1CEC7_9MYCO|nr:enoyl-CoA hydratase/isomerase family protein [Mycobacterium paragordonae]AYE99408.1 enoyl-CoA hydratase [Mycobacterium paragordonae]GFG82821.1 putative enoyl-CoA hydratase echA12 [Mycobacterium paragordonae]
MSTATTHWNRVSRRPLADVLDELRTARTLAFDECRPGIVVMSVNRPDRANSQTIEMFGEIAWATVTLRHAPLRALIVTGAGGKAFCTGFDLEEVDVLTRMSVSEFTDLIETAASGSTGLRALPYPVIAAVSGPAAGGGLSLALAADIRIADHTASFSAGFVRVGLSIGELGTSWNLVRLLGSGRASELAFTGRTVRAAEAFRIGLADRLTDTGTALDAALEVAETIAEHSDDTVRSTKNALVRNLENNSFRSALEVDNRGQALVMQVPAIASKLTGEGP